MGDYILFSDQKTVPSPDALFWMIKAVTEKKADMIYTDEDEVSTDGKHHYDPKFKPDFNLFRLRENNYSRAVLGNPERRAGTKRKVSSGI